MATDTQNLTISIPKDYDQQNMLLKLQKKVIKEEKVQKFRSFSFNTSNESVTIKEKAIHLQHLFKILKEHGLSETIPINISLSVPFKFGNFDWKPLCYAGSTVWYFTWNNIMCSITGAVYTIYIRVHNMESGVGETIMNEIIDELLKYWQNPVPSNSITIYTSLKAPVIAWIPLCSRLYRNLDTIYLDKQIKANLVNNINKFLDSSALYDKYGITWKRIHLFHGPPGSGKTSTILALASTFGKNIAKMTITPNLNGSDIEFLFQAVPLNTFILLEDADALFTERKSATAIDFSSLLNCMDGIATKRGLVLFMTTNHIIELDSAFIRPGRVDYILEFKLPDKEIFRDALKMLATNYEHEHEEFLSKCDNMSIAALQKHLFECIMDEKESILF